MERQQLGEESKEGKYLKVVVLGTRGIPNIPGGVETHCEQLYPRLVKQCNCNITLITRSFYAKEKISEFRGIKLKHLYAPRDKSFEAIVHSVIGVFYAWRHQTDIIHIHAIGPAIVIPLARILGMRVIMTHHGPDYDRAKWGRLAKMVLCFGEKMGARYADEIIVISQVIADILAQKYGRTNTHLIYNGVSVPAKAATTDYISTLGITPRKYIIAVGRFVEEKGFHDLIDAYASLKNTTIKLVLVGDADHKTTYSQNLKKKAVENGIILTGYIKGNPLQEIFSHARLFVMPSYHEGLPITLLEALAYGLDVLVSDILANREIGLHKGDYFSTGNVDELTIALQRKLRCANTVDYTRLLAKYDWDAISAQTWKVYCQRPGTSS